MHQILDFMGLLSGQAFIAAALDFSFTARCEVSFVTPYND
jgi:hypothetical protein